MNDLLTAEPVIRLSLFTATVIVLVISERARGRRTPRPRPTRWTNVGLLVTNTVLLRIVSTSSLIGISLMAQTAGWGVLSLIQLPSAIEIALAFVALDLVMYLQHRLYHWLPLLWRLHRVHHTDIDFDLSTGIRFHPGEMLFSFAIKAAAVVVLGAAPVAVLCFELVLSSSSLFTHANLTLPARLDGALRRIIVTPDMHRIHHCVSPDEHNRNFGFFLSWWDHLLGSYRQSPRGNHADMPIGLGEFRGVDEQTYIALMKQPWATE